MVINNLIKYFILILFFISLHKPCLTENSNLLTSKRDTNNQKNIQQNVIKQNISLLDAKLKKLQTKLDNINNNTYSLYLKKEALNENVKEIQHAINTLSKEQDTLKLKLIYIKINEYKSYINKAIHQNKYLQIINRLNWTNSTTKPEVIIPDHLILNIKELRNKRLTALREKNYLLLNDIEQELNNNIKIALKNINNKLVDLQKITGKNNYENNTINSKIKNIKEKVKINLSKIENYNAKIKLLDTKISEQKILATNKNAKVQKVSYELEFLQKHINELNN
ncbi:MAG: hypothetical protein SZ59_C0001G0045 [candidate division TM6 bacterium GW2011_GWF2_28_16]|nr:MAG: hypothetical protein SZ59_C0001G0045 [candidate division TM6 bacterium GW2011_GWF2_28_16]